MSIEDKLSQLEEILSKIRVVKKGDDILPEDHNFQTDALKIIKDILYEISGITPAPTPEVTAEEPEFSDWVEHKYIEYLVNQFPEWVNYIYGIYQIPVIYPNGNAIDMIIYVSADPDDCVMRFTFNMETGEIIHTSWLSNIDTSYLDLYGAYNQGYYFNIPVLSFPTGKYIAVLDNYYNPAKLQIWKNGQIIKEIDITDLTSTWYPPIYFTAIGKLGEYIICGVFDCYSEYEFKIKIKIFKGVS